MKKTLLPIFFCLFVSAEAQITLNQGNSAPAIGDVYTFLNCDTNIAQGPSGASQTWTFNSLAIDPTPAVQNFVDPSTTPYSGIFPTANVAQSDGHGNFEYLTCGASGVTILGAAASSNVTTYTSTVNVFTYPFTYLNSISNPAITGVFFSGTFTGSSSVLADAHGNLSINGRTFNNVLRVHYTQSYDYDYTGLGHMFVNLDTYYWFDGTHKSALLTITTSTITGLAIGSGKTVIVSDFVTGTQDLNNIAFDLYPNPANSSVTIATGREQIGTVSLSVYNTAGQRVMTREYPANVPGATLRLDVEALSPGVYALEMLSDGKRGSRTFVVE